MSKRKPWSERRGWETSFKQALLLRAEGAIRAFFDGYCRGDVASGVRSVVIARRYFFVGHCRGDIVSNVRNDAIPRPNTIRTLYLRRFLPHVKRNSKFAAPCLFFLFLSLSRSHFARYLLANSASASSNALRITLSMS